MERLDKIVSSAYQISRAEARQEIGRGKITVDGAVVRDIAKKVDPALAKIAYEGKSAEYKEHIYLIMNKPEGILSASRDEKRPTVINLVPKQLMRKGLFPVGRLDKNTTGLLLITDDGAFGHRLLSPKYKVPKTYHALLDGPITKTVIDGFKKGVTLADGTKVAPAILRPLTNGQVSVTIAEGKYHQIKRMFGVYNLGVNALKRVSFGGLNLPKDLKSGQVRECTPEELGKLGGTN